MDEFNEDNSLINPLHQDDLENGLVDVEVNQEPAQRTLRESFSEIVQLANFQLTDDVIRNSRRGQRRFDRKEIKASLNWKRQLFSLSTLLVIMQVGNTALTQTTKSNVFNHTLIDVS
ncbi:hypothetical protein EON65_00675 [archaeon]|nr:MAG: hypothetical protein EON65_00675 [archaeon]